MLADLTRGDTATLAFQGGEPTLVGFGFFRDLLCYSSGKAKERGVKLNYTLQTNGMEVGELWIPLLQEYPVLVGLSLDGYKQLHDSNRRSNVGGDTYKQVIRAKELFDKNKIQYNILFTLTNQAARHPQRVWRFLRDMNIGYVQFTPCLDSLDEESGSVYALRPERFYRFYSELFPLWISELNCGNYISVKLFDDLANYFGKGIPTVCGINGRCAIQYVCEGDGSVFPCDFYMLDNYRMGSLTQSKPGQLKDAAQEFLSSGREYVSVEPCKSCRYLEACNGGCKRMVKTMYLSRGVCWYSKLVDEILAPLLKAASRLSSGVTGVSPK
jgi:uncharacterized protein